MSTESEKIAVVGMACRFPGARNLEEYWHNLISGIETIKHFSEDELKQTETDFETLINNPNFVKSRGVINDIDKFDAPFFGYTPNEAARTDPQHRIWLQTVWECFENAGCDPYKYNGAVGVFAGSFLNTYLLNNVLQNEDTFNNYVKLRTTESFQILTGNDAAFIPTKTAYHFNLKGPAVNVQTACSTSLVAISQACQSLYSYESDACLAGGVCILTPQETGYIYQEGAIPSPDGHCRPFDKDGQGTVLSNGVGVVMLKRLEDAVTERDHIYAVIDGWGINNDGNNKVSYMAPSVDGQAEAIVMAQTLANIHPEEIGYVEAHGTGTPLGDPIEISALTKAFSRSSDKKQYCGIGSVKSNIGHTDAAAGVASFIKVCLAAYHKKIPATLNFRGANPHIDFENSPFFVVDKTLNWHQQNKLILGVSSFGIGGTNAHVLVEEPPKLKIEDTEKFESSTFIVPISAKNSEALQLKKQELSAFLSSNAELNITDIAHTLWEGRNHMEYRGATLVSKNSDLREKLVFETGKTAENIKSIAFMFPGQGAQFIKMGKSLYEENKRFRSLVDEGFEVYIDVTGKDLKTFIFNGEDEEIAEKQLSQTAITQPALFIIEYSLAQLLYEQNVIPDNLIGHSIGEYAGACLAGVFDYATALKIVIKRGQLMQQMASGKMYAVKCTKKKLIQIADSLYELAAENAPESCTVSFNASNTERIKQLFEQHEIQYLPLNTSHAFHSKSFEPILEEFAAFVNQFTLNVPTIPIISCSTGQQMTVSQATSGEYWAQQLRNPVLFYKGIKEINKNNNTLFLEVGPNTHLSSILRTVKGISKKCAFTHTIGSPGKKDDYILERTFARLWLNLQNYKPSKFIPEKGNKIVLPSYPFEQKRYWIERRQNNRRQNVCCNDNASIINKNADEILQRNVKLEIKQILASLSGYPISEIKSKATFDELGFSSLFLAQFARKLELHFKLKINFRQLAVDYTSVNDLNTYITENITTEPISKIDKFGSQSEVSFEKNFVKIQPKGSKEPIILLHGEILNRILPKHLGQNQPFYGFLHLGSDGEKVPFTNIRQMAESYLDQLITELPEGPYILGGYSIGGVLAYEMAILMQERGYDVPKLILLDCKNPAAKESFDWEQGYIKTIRNRIIKPLYYYLFKLTMVRTISRICFMLNMPIPINRRRNYIFSIYFDILRKYRYKQKLFNGQVILFKASENDSSLKYLGWDKLTSELELVTVKGNHASFLNEIEENGQIKAKLKDFIEAKTESR